MPLSIHKNLKVREIKPTKVTLQLVDGSIKYTKGMLENVPI